MIIFRMHLQMIRQLFDLLGKDGNLNLRGTGIGIVCLIPFDELFFVSSL